MRTAVVLPAPFGTEQPVDGAGLHVQVDAFQRLHLSVVLAQAGRVDRARVRHRPDASEATIAGSSRAI